MKCPKCRTNLAVVLATSVDVYEACFQSDAPTVPDFNAPYCYRGAALKAWCLNNPEQAILVRDVDDSMYEVKGGLVHAYRRFDQTGYTFVSPPVVFIFRPNTRCERVL